MYFSLVSFVDHMIQLTGIKSLLNFTSPDGGMQTHLRTVLMYCIAR